MMGAKEAGIRAILLDRRNKREFIPKIVNLRELKDLIEKDELDEFASQEMVMEERREEQKEDQK